MKTISGKQECPCTLQILLYHIRRQMAFWSLSSEELRTCAFWNAMEIFQVFWANSMNNVNACKLVIMILNMRLSFHTFRGLCQITLWDTKSSTTHGTLKLFSECLLRKHNWFPCPRPTENQTLFTHTLMNGINLFMFS